MAQAKKQRALRRGRIVTGRVGVKVKGMDATNVEGFDVAGYEQKIVAKLVGRAKKVPGMPEYVPLQCGEKAYIKYLRRWCKEVRGNSMYHTAASLNDIGRMVFYDLVEAMYTHRVGAAVATNLMRATAVMVANSVTKYGALGGFSMAGGMNIDRKGPVNPALIGKPAMYFADLIGCVFLGYRLCTQMEAVYVLMLVADEIRDIEQQAKVQIAYRKGVLSQVNMAEFGD